MVKRTEDYFWYVLDLDLGEAGEVVANPFVDDMAERTYIFTDQEDVSKWAHIIQKTPAHAGHRIGIQSDLYSSLLQDVKEEFGRFILTPISHDEAQKLFENFPDELLDFAG